MFFSTKDKIPDNCNPLFSTSFLVMDVVLVTCELHVVWGQVSYIRSRAIFMLEAISFLILVDYRLSI